MIRNLWVPFQWTGSLALKLALLVPSAIGVLFSVVADGRHRTPAIWRWCADAESTPAEWKTSRWKLWWYWAVRNPVKVMELPRVADYVERGAIDERLPGLQYRWRRTRWLDSFRVVWGEPRADKGKREFYIGWKIGSTSPNKFTIQFRPF